MSDVTQKNGTCLVDGEYGITDLIDLERLHGIFEKFTHASGFTIGFLDHPGLNILVATGWRDICTKFHRSCPASQAICAKSNQHLLDALNEPGQLVIEACDNGLIDCATPIIVKGKHIASLATGQLLLEPPDIERFRRQAKMYGYDEQAYLAALKEIPIISRETLQNITLFLGEIASVISELGYTNLAIKEDSKQLEHEIAERKKAEEKIKESEKYFRTIFDTATDGILIADLENKKFAMGNRSICQQLGYSPEEIKQLGVMDIHPEKDLSYVMDQFEKQAKGEFTLANNIPIKRKDGTIFYTDVNSNTITLDGKKHLLGFFRDITERKQAEEELRFSSLYTRSLIEASLDPLVTINAEGKINDVNHSTEEITGFSRKELIGSDFSNYCTEPDKAIESYKKVLTEGFVRDYHLTLKHKSGSAKDVLYNATVYKNESGQIQGVFAAARDITERKKAEDQLKKMNFELQGKIHELEIYSNAMIGREERVLELKNEIKELKKKLNQ